MKGGRKFVPVKRLSSERKNLEAHQPMGRGEEVKEEQSLIPIALREEINWLKDM